MQGSGGRKIPLPTATSRPFWGARGRFGRLFLQEERAQTARPLPGCMVVLLVWRSLQGPGRRLCMTDRPTLKVPGRLARIPLFGSCMACGLVLDASHLAGELVRGCRLALAEYFVVIAELPFRYCKRNIPLPVAPGTRKKVSFPRPRVPCSYFLMFSTSCMKRRPYST